MLRMKNKTFSVLLSLLLVFPFLNVHAKTKNELAEEWIQQLYIQGMAGRAVIYRLRAELCAADVAVEKEVIERIVRAAECGAHALMDNFFEARVALAKEHFGSIEDFSKPYLDAHKHYVGETHKYRIPLRNVDQELGFAENLTLREYFFGYLQRYGNSSRSVYPAVLKMVALCEASVSQAEYDVDQEEKLTIELIRYEELLKLKQILLKEAVPQVFEQSKTPEVCLAAGAITKLNSFVRHPITVEFVLKIDDSEFTAAMDCWKDHQQWPQGGPCSTLIGMREKVNQLISILDKEEFKFEQIIPAGGGRFSSAKWAEMDSVEELNRYQKSFSEYLKESRKKYAPKPSEQ